MAKILKEKKIRQHWQKIVSTYFEFCREKFGENPSFDGCCPRDLGMIIDAIEKKAVEKNIEWSESTAIKSLNIFLDYSFKDEWLQKNFLLFNLNRQKDKIFYKIKSVLDGKSDSITQRISGNNKTAGQHIFAERLRGRIEKLK